ncbi:alpha/beta hydrolase [Aureibacter tunicatorum]|uniref:PET hydrolase/cutinase-like domain-containing protein n=1 Tax=Aureibacter tunicatorum TaxID=866807 RepID=A0AAE3XQG8_9BACT|nr:alpha/beta fold hydrolase [Aureibacter tunicatorum]MDR6240755.1 hypothetical protein [Aureibacter tunicatorum]BDD06912.1 hypothetical protein AUTU_43950 [Aureibacter tunicatorum]
MEKVNFESEGVNLVGNLYFPENYDAAKTYPAIVVLGSWTTVKEQMAGLYADRLSKEGFITLAFDFRNYGESGGEPRYYECPEKKVRDIVNAVSFLSSLKEVDENRIGAFAVCAGSMYTLMAASEDSRIKAVVTAASWLHDAEAVKLFYGGEEGVSERISLARHAKKVYNETGKVEYVPTISLDDARAAMIGNFDYYLNPNRGGVPQWSADKFAVMSWEDWLTLDPMPSAPSLKAATLMIHSDGCVLPQYTKNYFEKIGTSDKELKWVDTNLDSPMDQFNYYDQEEQVGRAVDYAQDWFHKKL